MRIDRDSINPRVVRDWKMAAERRMYILFKRFVYASAMHLVDNAHSKYNDNQYSPIKAMPTPTTQGRGKVNKKNQQDDNKRKRSKMFICMVGTIEDRIKGRKDADLE